MSVSVKLFQVHVHVAEREREIVCVEIISPYLQYVHVLFVVWE